MNREPAVYFVVAAGLLFGGCAKQGPGDDAIANDIKAKLYSDPATKAANIGVAAKDGVVTLTGDAPSSDAELAAVKSANSEPGVKRVDDQIKVNTAQLPDAGNAQAPASAPAANPYSAQPSPPPPAPAAPPPPVSAVPAPVEDREHREEHEHRERTIPAGAQVAVRTIDTIDSRAASAGQTFAGTLNQAVVDGAGRPVIPAGADVVLTIANARSAGRVEGKAELAVQLLSVRVHGEMVRVESTTVTEVGKSRGKQTAERSGIGAAAGAIIGAIAGGGKGAAIGAAAGGGAGLGYQVFTHGQQVKIPSESVLVFTLEAPLTLR